MSASIFVCASACGHCSRRKKTEQDTTNIQPEITRLAGNEGKNTAVDIASEAYEGGTSDWVIIARDDDFADSMSSTGLAGVLDAPILLTDRLVGLDADAIEKINALGATHAYIIGGEGAIPFDVEAQLKANTKVESTERVWGHDYYDTSVKCYEKIKEHAASNNETITDAIVAMGRNFQDALSISSFAYKYHLPIFLQTDAAETKDCCLPDESVAAVRDIVGTESDAKGTIYVPGGTGALSKESVEDVFGESLCVRMAGYTGYDTSNEIAKYLTSKEGGYKLSANTVVIANGAEAPKGTDALAGSSLAGKNSGVILLTNTVSGFGDTSTTTISGSEAAAGQSAQTGFLADNAKNVSVAYVLGGTVVMPQDTSVEPLKPILWNWKLVSFVTTGAKQAQTQASTIPSQKVWKGEAPTRPQTAKVEGYTLNGWYMKADLTGEFDFSKNTIQDNATLYGQWAASSKTSDSGNATVADNNGNLFNVAITDKQGSPIVGASAFIDNAGKVSVVLPASAIATDVVVTVTDVNDNAVKDKDVTVKESDGSMRATGKTDSDGKFEAAASISKDARADTDDSGKVTVTDSDGKKFTTVVKDKDGNPIEGATVTVDKNGTIIVQLPDTESDGSVDVEIKGDEDEPATNKTVTITDSDGTNQGTVETDADGKATFLPIPEDKIKIADADNQVYTGTAHKPAIEIEGLEYGLDYTVSYVDNINAGTASVIVQGIGKYSGTVNKTFEIKKAKLTIAKGAITAESKTYDGTTDAKLIVDSTKVTGLVDADKDKQVSITGTGTFYDNEGNKTSEVGKGLTIKDFVFTISPADVAVNYEAEAADAQITGGEIKAGSIEGLADQVKLEPSTFEYTGNKCEPKVTIGELAEGEDFEVVFTNNIEVGTATATITGKGKLAGTITKTFTITKAKPAQDEGIEIDAKANQTLSELTSSLPATYGGIEGTWTWKEAGTTSVGSETATKTYKATFTPKDTKNYEVVEVDVKVNVTAEEVKKTIPEDKISLSSDKFTYAGDEKKPTVTIDGLKEGTDFTVSYEDNIDVGTAKVIITGIGDYAGSSVTKEFTIDKATPKGSVDAIDASANQTLSELTSSLPETFGGIEGTWSWVDAGTTSVGSETATKTYKATFTPKDTKNYETVTVDVPVNVDASKMEGTTESSGEVTLVDKSGNTYKVKVTDDASPANSVSGAKVTLSDKGEITVTLPNGNAASGKGITVNVTDGKDNAKETSVTLVDNTTNRGTKTTDKTSGNATFVGYSGVTGTSSSDTPGVTQVFDPTTNSGDVLTVTVSYKNGSGTQQNVENATVAVDPSTGKMTVTLPEGSPALYQEVTVNVKDSKGKYLEKSVTLNDNTTTRATKTSAADTGNAVFSMVTDANGEIQVTKDGTVYKVTVSAYSSAKSGDLLPGAAVAFNDSGKLVVTTPSSADSKDILVSVVKVADNSAVGDVSVVVNKSNGTTEIDSGKTSTTDNATSGLKTGQYRAHNGVSWTQSTNGACICLQETVKTGSCSVCSGGTVTEIISPAKGHVKDDGSSALEQYGGDDNAQHCTTCDHVLFGTYPQTSAGTDSTPIEWVKLGDPTDGVQKLLAFQALNAVVWNKGDDDSGHEWSSTCYIRDWLNSTGTFATQSGSSFYNKAFTTNTQKAKIVSTDTDGANCNVFLLSYEEAKAIEDAGNIDDLLCIPTAYALNADNTDSGQIASPASNGCVWWWLRSGAESGGSETAGHVAPVIVTGATSYVSSYGYSVTNRGVGVRPAINFSLTSVSDTKGTATVKNPKDNTSYKVTLAASSTTEAGSALEAAKVKFSDSGVLTVTSPDTTTDAKDIVVTVTTADTAATPQGNISVVVNKSDGTKKDSGTTLAANGQYRGHTNVSTTVTSAINDGGACVCVSGGTVTTTTVKCSICEGGATETNTETIAAGSHTLENYGTDSTAQHCTRCDHVIFGSYQQTAAGGDSTGIEWIKLGKAVDGKQKLLSLQALDCVKWNNNRSKDGNDWSKTCNVRTWLNNTFYNAAFTSDQKLKISLTNLVTNTYNTTTQLCTTSDNVFLLSVEEANDVTNFPNGNSDRLCTPTAFAKSTNTNTNFAASCSSDGYCQWWLRSPGSTLQAAYINTNGSVNAYGQKTDNNGGMAVRPAITFNVG